MLLSAGRPTEAEKWRQIKGDQEKTKDWYVYHIFPKDRLDHAAELARAAEKVGRVFEARCWWELAAKRPDWAGEACEQIARLDREAAKPTTNSSGLTPANLAAELDALAPMLRSSKGLRPGGAIPHFTNDAEVAGLRFTFDCSVLPARQMPEASSGGVALLDYDGDGWMDVFVVQGGPFPPPVQPTAASPDGGDRLFRNRGDGTFEDVSLHAGISSYPRGYGHGVGVGDIDNDGWPDLFITRWRSYALFATRATAHSRMSPGLGGLGATAAGRLRRLSATLTVTAISISMSASTAYGTRSTRHRATIRSGNRTAAAARQTIPRFPTNCIATTAAGLSTYPRKPALPRRTRTEEDSACSPPTWTATDGRTSSSPMTSRPSISS